MKKYLVIGNPIEHSLSPKLHNYWIKKNNIDAVYEKKKINNKEEIKDVITQIKNNEIQGINVTIPFKKYVISFLDKLTPLAEEVQSVNTIYKKDNKIIGDNTDIDGFENGLKHINYNPKNKKIFIIGAGGVVPSIITVLKRLNVSKIFLSNRTKEKADFLKKIYPEIEVINWGEIVDFDMIINSTSLGLQKNDQIKLNLDKASPNKLFYDVIYNPSKTNFLKEGERLGNKIENGKMMFIYQAQLAFKIWHNVLPKVEDNLLN